jgi:putative flippase GtrA
VRSSAGILDRISASPRQLLKELAAFGVVGGLAFLLDLGTFQVLYSHGVGAVTAKAVSTVLATTAAYLGNRYWSFSHRSTTSVRREFLVFVVINGITGVLNLAIIAFVRYVLHQDSAAVLQAANVIGIGAGTIIRYGSYRKWVFTEPAAEPRTDLAEVEEKQPVGAGRPQAPEAA